METNILTYTAKDFKSDQQVRWCPGWGLRYCEQLAKVMADLGVPPHKQQ